MCRLVPLGTAGWASVVGGADESGKYHRDTHCVCARRHDVHVGGRKGEIAAASAKPRNDRLGWAEEKGWIPDEGTRE